MLGKKIEMGNFGVGGGVTFPLYLFGVSLIHCGGSKKQPIFNYACAKPVWQPVFFYLKLRISIYFCVRCFAKIRVS